MTMIRNHYDERSRYVERSGLLVANSEDGGTSGSASAEATVEAVSLLVEAKDPYTAGHQRRVAQLARAIANKMELSEWQVAEVHLAGLLHDAGKIAVPMAILSKPAKLSQDEFDLIKKHPEAGSQTLEDLGFPRPVTQAILQHHERLNGSGYPAGLSGERIILSARIIAVADVVEAMSSWRPYRPAPGLDQALEEVRRQRGALYDPDVVAACLKLLWRNVAHFGKSMLVQHGVT